MSTAIALSLKATSFVLPLRLETRKGQSVEAKPIADSGKIQQESKELPYFLRPDEDVTQLHAIRKVSLGVFPPAFRYAELPTQLIRENRQ